MTHAGIVRAGVIASLLGVALLLTGTGYLAWQLVLQHTTERLETLARLASQRADKTFAQAAAALRELNRSLLPPCSAEAIEEMRLVTINTAAVKAVGYVEEEVFVCSSWGLVGKGAQRWLTEFNTREGLGVSVNVRPFRARAKPMLSLEDAAFNLLIEPEHFLETALSPDVSLALGTPTGHWLGTPDTDFSQVLTRIHSEPHTALREGYLYTRMNHGNWQTVAAVGRESLVRDLWRELLMLMPLGLFLSGLWCWMVAHRVRAYLSPLSVLKRAVANNEFTAFYQPIIDLRSNRCVGAEALVRWIRSDGQCLSPDSFLPLAEKHGFIEPITDQVMAAICSDLGSYLRSDRSRHVSLNLCAADISNGRYLSVVSSALQGADIGPRQVWLEVTESALVDIEPARNNLRVSQARRHLIALDDFGTGYSSLQYLEQLPLDLIKIDKSFVKRVGEKRSCAVTEHTIAIARRLGLMIVAEGIETREQLHFLRLHGVEFGQGWLFGKAMPAHEFVQFPDQVIEPNPPLFQV